MNQIEVELDTCYHFTGTCFLVVPLLVTKTEQWVLGVLSVIPLLIFT